VSAIPRNRAMILAQAADAVGPLIRSWVNGLPSETRHVAGLHFGWWSDDGAVLPADADGKGLRPALALLACQAVGGAPEDAHPAAAAVELIHNASLLHDDIIDHDTLRRGRPALWAIKGLPAALLAGDALFFTAVQALTAADHSAQAIPVLLRTGVALIEGEYLDTLLEADTADEDRAVAVAAAKTGELFACACELGALAGGADPARTGHLRAFGHHLGVAFQCVDDLLGIWGNDAVTGKPTHSDLRARKISLPVAAALAGTTPQAEALRALYRQKEPLSEQDCLRAAQLIEQTDARKTTTRHAQQHSADALHHLHQARPTATAAAELAALAEFVTARDN
jgi:geranylgeranyl diphosphate synthase, type I